MSAYKLSVHLASRTYQLSRHMRQSSLLCLAHAADVIRLFPMQQNLKKMFSSRASWWSIRVNLIMGLRHDFLGEKDLARMKIKTFFSLSFLHDFS